MTIYIRNRKGKWAKSFDNYTWLLNLHVWLAKQRWWQLLITPRHIILGAWYGYTSKQIYWFVSRHIKENLQKKNETQTNNQL